MEKVEQYEIYELSTDNSTGIVVDSLEEAKSVIIDLEKSNTIKYIPLPLEEYDSTYEIY